MLRDPIRGPGQLMHGIMQIHGVNNLGMSADVADYLSKRDGNIIACQGIRFSQNIFTMTILFTAAINDFRRIRREINVIQHINPHVSEITEPIEIIQDDGILYEITVYTVDAPSIINDISRHIAAKNNDIIQLSASCYPTPQAGAPTMFIAEMIIQAPDLNAGSSAQEALTALAKERGWEFEWQPAKTARIAAAAIFPPSRMSRTIIANGDIRAPQTIPSAGQEAIAQ